MSVSDLLMTLFTKEHFWEGFTAITTAVLALSTIITLGATVYYSKKQLNALNEKNEMLNDQLIKEKHQRARNCAIDFYSNLTLLNEKYADSSTIIRDKAIRGFISDVQRIRLTIFPEDYNSLKEIKDKALEFQQALHGHQNIEHHMKQEIDFSQATQERRKVLKINIDNTYLSLLTCISNYLNKD